jgi:biopolymer transport protein TolQ
MQTVRSFADLVAVGKECHDGHAYQGIGGSFLTTALSELKILLDEKNPVLTDRDIAILESELIRSVGDLITRQEEYLPVLSTSAMAAPLVGLFGTIWGLIHAFIDISQEKSADIATVAPGLAEALIVTLGGLAVAIPALISFHYFATKVRSFDHQLNDIGDRFLNIIKQTFVK